MAEKINKDAMRAVLPEARLSHPHLFKATAYKGRGQEYYSAELLFDKATTPLKVLQAPMIAALKAKWGAQSEWPKSFKKPYRDGDKPHGINKEVKPEHKGMWVVKASSSAKFQRPALVDEKRKPITEESKLYPGCFVHAAIMASAYDAANSEALPGVKFVLDGVQFAKKGPSFGGRKPADQMFGVLESEDGEEESFENFEDLADDLSADGDEIPF